jgi:integrase
MPPKQFLMGNEVLARAPWVWEIRQTQVEGVAASRSAPLHPLLAAHLLNWRRETPYGQEENLVFPSFKLKGRKPPRANMLLSDHLRPAALKVGVVAPPRAFGFHTFRRTLASVLVANNYDPKLVQELLRHSNIKTTLDIYT